MAQRIPVLYILSVSHSGSTLLDLLLGSHSQIESVGELERIRRFTTEQRLRDNKDRKCTCGSYLEDCPFWSQVETIRQVALTPADAQPAVDSGSSPTFDPTDAGFMAAILQVSGARYICDSSKNLDRLRYYISHPGLFATTVIHLVRDGRAVAFSEQRKGRSYYRHLWKWYRTNRAMAQVLSHADGVAWRTLRYEDLCAHPASALTSLMSELGLDFESEQLQFLDQKHHNISGNRMRAAGSSVIEPDMRYLNALSPLKWLASWVLVGRRLRHYAYAFFRRKDAHSLDTGKKN